MPTTALIAAGVGAAGSVASSVIGSNAAKSAAQQQADAQRAALAQQQALYNQGLSTATNALNPYVQAGQSVLPTLQNLLTPGPSQTAALAQTPGFQFQSQYGTLAATNALAARGQGASAGPLATAVSQFNNGLAGTTWQNVVNALQGYANMGTSAAGTLGTAALGGAINAGNAQASTIGNIGNAQAAGTLGSANALSSGINSVAGSASNALLLNKLLPSSAANTGIYGGAGPGSLFMGGGSPTGL